MTLKNRISTEERRRSLKKQLLHKDFIRINEAHNGLSSIIGNNIKEKVGYFFHYLLFFLGNILILFFLIMGGVAVVSTSTIYTVIHHEGSTGERKTKKKMLPKSKSIKKRHKAIHGDIPPIFENYIKTLLYRL